MHMLRGSNEIELAWLARGNGFSSEVTEEGWRGFKEHLTQARDIFVETWEAFPNRPESATAMITVTRGGTG